MKAEGKWLLQSGRYVEDIVYRFGQSQEKESICHSFTIDLSDELIRNSFTDDEWNEILTTNVKQDIPLSEDVKSLLEALNKKPSLKEIRQVIGEKLNEYLVMDYNEVFDKIQICYAALSLIMLYEMSPCHLMCPQLELWYECNVWTPLLDKLYGDIHGVICIRGEPANLSTKRRKASDGTNDKGVKNDLIIRDVGGGHLLEFGAGETSSSYHDGLDAKHLYESKLKLPKTLRDMLMDLCLSVDWNPAIVRKLEVIGYLHHGLVTEHLLLDNPCGYICRLKRLKRFQVPSHVAEFGSALQLFSVNLKLKKRAQRCIEIVREQKSDLKLDTDIDLLPSPSLPPTFTTPPRNQGKYKKRSIQQLYFRD
ncbi:unnamed protein product [Absidia cylindrospora]